MAYENTTQALDQAAETLEALVDKHSLAYVLELLGRVCHEKAEHLRSNWQDDVSAREWDRDATVCERAACKV
jgi:hypothetical protein